MKIFLTYGLLTYLLLLLHIGVSDVLCLCQSEPAVATPGTQLIAHQEPTTRQAIHKFYDYCSGMSCDIIKKTQDIRGVKYILRDTLPYKNLQELLTSNQGGQHTSFLHSHDPVSYYVFGMRKIII